ncbi:Metallothionein expression activator [Blastocladiella emersonii ATCC 22665]|nr:Metallothionein expression activator [Blastocladiella emersonii ATCC 22665]
MDELGLISSQIPLRRPSVISLVSDPPTPNMSSVTPKPGSAGSNATAANPADLAAPVHAAASSPLPPPPQLPLDAPTVASTFTFPPPPANNTLSLLDGDSGSDPLNMAGNGNNGSGSNDALGLAGETLSGASSASNSDAASQQQQYQQQRAQLPLAQPYSAHYASPSPAMATVSPYRRSSLATLLPQHSQSQLGGMPTSGLAGQPLTAIHDEHAPTTSALGFVTTDGTGGSNSGDATGHLNTPAASPAMLVGSAAVNGTYGGAQGQNGQYFGTSVPSNASPLAVAASRRRASLPATMFSHSATGGHPPPLPAHAQQPGFHPLHPQFAAFRSHPAGTSHHGAHRHHPYAPSVTTDGGMSDSSSVFSVSLYDQNGRQQQQQVMQQQQQQSPQVRQDANAVPTLNAAEPYHQHGIPPAPMSNRSQGSDDGMSHLFGQASLGELGPFGTSQPNEMYPSPAVSYTPRLPFESMLAPGSSPAATANGGGAQTTTGVMPNGDTVDFVTMGLMPQLQQPHQLQHPMQQQQQQMYQLPHPHQQQQQMGLQHPNAHYHHHQHHQAAPGSSSSSDEAGAGDSGNEGGLGDSPQAKRKEGGGVSGAGGASGDFPCPHPGCGKVFQRNHNLKSHMLTHSEDKPYLCTKCDMAFRRNHDLRRHYRLHSGVKPYVCPRCDKRFSRSDALRRHVKVEACVSGVVLPLASPSAQMQANMSSVAAAAAASAAAHIQQQQQQQQGAAASPAYAALQHPAAQSQQAQQAQQARAQREQQQQQQMYAAQLAQQQQQQQAYNNQQYAQQQQQYTQLQHPGAQQQQQQFQSIQPHPDGGMHQFMTTTGSASGTPSMISLTGVPM